MLFTTFVVITALCLLIPITRMYAVIGAGLLLYFYTYLTLGVLLVAGGAFFYYHWRNSHAH